MFMELFKALTNKSFSTKFGVLNGYTQFFINDNSGQAAIIPFPDRMVDGVVYMDIDEESLAILDAFQGKNFIREEVTIEGEGGEWLDAFSYCLKLSRKSLLTSDEWSEDVYRDKYLKKVLKSCRE